MIDIGTDVRQSLSTPTALGSDAIVRSQSLTVIMCIAFLGTSLD